MVAVCVLPEKAPSTSKVWLWPLPWMAETVCTPPTCWPSMATVNSALPW